LFFLLVAGNNLHFVVLYFRKETARRENSEEDKGIYREQEITGAVMVRYQYHLSCKGLSPSKPINIIILYF
jgi:hypothetical protein